MIFAFQPSIFLLILSRFLFGLSFSYTFNILAMFSSFSLKPLLSINFPSFFPLLSYHKCRQWTVRASKRNRHKRDRILLFLLSICTVCSSRYRIFSTVQSKAQSTICQQWIHNDKFNIMGNLPYSQTCLCTYRIFFSSLAAAYVYFSFLLFSTAITHTGKFQLIFLLSRRVKNLFFFCSFFYNLNTRKWGNFNSSVYYTRTH